MKKRTLSAIVMIAIFVPLLFIGGIYFSCLMGVLGLLGLYELISIREIKKKFPFMIKLFVFILFILLMVFNYGRFDYIYNIDYRFLSISLFALITPIVFINNSDKYNISDALYLIGSLMFIGVSFSSMSLIRTYSIYFFIYLLLVQTMTDTFAYITGCLIGTHKFTTISPNKSIEGCIGGTLMGTFIAVAFYNTVINPGMSLVVLILITVILSVCGQIGDLCFSAIKRYFEKKDFSDLIPGHGGILDRFDSLIFITLAFVIIISYL